MTPAVINDFLSGGSRISETGEDANPKGGDTNLLFGQLIVQNYTKMKKNEKHKT